MKISTNWINDYVKIDDVDKKELADKITNAGCQQIVLTACVLFL